MVLAFAFCSRSVVNAQVSFDYGVWIEEWVDEPLEESAPLLFVDFWATWCAPCRAVQPHIEQLSDMSKGVVDFMQISQESSYTVGRYLVKNPSKHAMAIDFDKKTHDLYSVHVLPHAALLGPHGELLWSGSPSDMKFSDLKRWMEKYSGVKTSAPRVHMIKFMETADRAKELFHTMESDFGNTSYYLSQDNQNYIEKSKDSVIVNGSINYILYQLNGLEEINFGLKGNCDDARRWTITFPRQDVIKSLSWFLKTEGYSMSVESERVNKVTISGLDSSKLWSTGMYDYGPGVYLASEYTMEIDDATPAKAFEIMSNQSKYSFELKDVDYQGVHDWNIYYFDDKGMMDQLTLELGLEAELEVKEENIIVVGCE